MDADRSHILIVEDDPSVRQYFAEVLQLAGYATTEAGTISEATAILAEGTPEIICVLLDLHLPDGHAINLLRAVRDDAGTEMLPVIIVTGDLDAHGEITGLDAGATDYVFKPVGPEALAARVAARLRDRAAWLATVELSNRRGPDLDELARREVLSQRVERVARSLAFTSVFQPIVDLRERSTVAYEALTRLADGTPPDQFLRGAAEVGRGIDIELMLLQSSVDASGLLPEVDFVSLNVSPGLLRMAANEVHEILDQLDRQAILEITEREAIDDYEWIRAIVRSLGPTVGLSIDDTGAGFASLRHVLMLEPEYVKLDKGWVSEIDANDAKQAMVAGLAHFAEATGCTLIAEGVESESERRTLIGLGVELGQGYLFGMPTTPAPTSERLPPQTP